MLCDRDAHQVLCFNLCGSLLMTLGERHRPYFQAPFNHPADAAMALTATLSLPTATLTRRSTVFRLTEWRDFYHPMDLYIDRQGRTYVTDQIPRLSMVDARGTLIGRCRPVLCQPHGVFGDSLGNLYIAEPAPMDRVTKLTRLTDAS